MITQHERVLGCLYGMATGDALGVPSSFLTPEHIRRVWGWIDTFYPPEKGHIFHDGLNAGEYTDDTEQALALINGRAYVTPDDVKRMRHAALRHRIILNFEAAADDVHSEAIIDAIFSKIRTP